MNRCKKLVTVFVAAMVVTATFGTLNDVKPSVSFAEETKSENQDKKKEENKVEKGRLAWQLLSGEEALQDATWTVQEWDKDKKAYTDMAKQPKVTFHEEATEKWGVKFNHFYATDLLSITAQNEGWFRVVEKTAPAGYVNAGVTYEACLTKSSSGNTIHTTEGNEAVAIAKKALTNEKQKPAEETNITAPKTDLAEEKKEKENSDSLQLFGNTVIEDVTQEENSTGNGGTETEVTSRQFIKFATTDGNVYYIVINHTNQGDRVLMLREVSTADLAAIAKSGNQGLDPLITQAFTDKQSGTAAPVQNNSGNPVQSPAGKTTTTPNKVNYPLLIGTIIFVLGGLVYIFVIKKKKPTQKEEPEYDYEDYEDEE